MEKHWKSLGPYSKQAIGNCSGHSNSQQLVDIWCRVLLITDDAIAWLLPLLWLVLSAWLCWETSSLWSLIVRFKYCGKGRCGMGCQFLGRQPQSSGIRCAF